MIILLLILTLMVKRLLSPFKASESYVLVTRYIKGEIRCLPRENNSWVRWQQLIYLASKSQRGVAELWLLLGQNQLTGGISAQQKENSLLDSINGKWNSRRGGRQSCLGNVVSADARADSVSQKN